MYDDDQSSQIGRDYKQLFDQSVFEARKEIHRQGGRKMSPVRLGGRKMPSRDPSIT